jgi:hypothetical protein
MYLQLRIFRPQYSTERICVAIGDMPIFGCALYCKFGAIYSALSPIYAMETVIPHIYNEVTGANIQAPIFN